MKESQNYLRKNIEKEWEVKSDNSDDIYNVQLLKDGSWKCDCVAGAMGKECKHIERKKFYYERNQVKFEGYNLTLKFLKTDKSWRVEIETSLDQWDKIAVIPKLPEGQIYEITIKPKE